MRKEELANQLLMSSLYILGIAILTALFSFVWYRYYASAIIYPFFRRGNWMVIFVYMIILLFAIYLNDGQKIGYFPFGQTIFSQLIGMVLADLMMYLIISLIGRQFMNFLPMLALMFVQGAVLWLWTFMSDRFYHYINPPRKMVLVSGKGRHVESLIAKVSIRKDKYQIAERITEDEGIEHILPRLRDYDAVMMCDLNITARNQIIKYCFEQNIRVYVVPRISDLIMRSANEIRLFDSPLLLCHNYGLSLFQRFYKRFFDIVLSIIALVLVSPLFIGIMIAIKAEDGGPVFYRQERLTTDGRQFMILKFRSMKVNAERDGARLATQHDSRITKVGHFLRRYRLDELPQFLNILKGDMSLVGPRPERPEIAEQIKETIPEFDYRLKVKAGLTGLAQVQGKYNTTPYDKLEMDLIYISNFSFLEDLKIILMTPKMLFVHDGSEGVADE